ncbi:MAG: transmembrane prediction [SAR86 cluster bacterium]|uniref:Transmembrane prediction n=1 Tax=SAR86 cluster bacterium TaxID=2030880 RepID=A0A2A4MIW0_9GAMM|nr:MAG: transmembrane prediction [SAR86 cluster bacterium]
MRTKSLVIALLWCSLAMHVNAQRADLSQDQLAYDSGGEFNFVRVQFDTYFSSGFRGGPWLIDFPDADTNFLRGVSRLTNIRVMSEPIVLRFDDDAIYNYPFLYMLEVGQAGGIVLSPKEIENLREYLLRGGFLLIDDFWGVRQWDNFYASFSQVFPDREIVELGNDHEIFHCYYDIDGPQLIPALGRSQDYGEQGIDYASNHAILDDEGRIMVLINWNSDMGDGWEHTYHPSYPTRYANSAYQLGINYLMYSMTH